MWDKRKVLFKTLVTPFVILYVILYHCEAWGCTISKKSRRRINQNQKLFITYNLKIKSKTPYSILLLEEWFSQLKAWL